MPDAAFQTMFRKDEIMADARFREKAGATPTTVDLRGYTACASEHPPLGEVVKGIHVATNGYRTILGDVKLVKCEQGGYFFYAHSQARVPADRLPTHWKAHA